MKNTTKTIKKDDISFESLEFTRVIAEAKNINTKVHNKYMAPVINERNLKLLLGKLTADDIKKLKEKERKAFVDFKKEQSKAFADLKLGEVYQKLKIHYVPESIMAERLHEKFDWEYFGDIGTIKPQQPGVVVRGSGHPCCLWYSRQETKEFNYNYGPSLQPEDYSLTSFNENLLASNKFQVKFGIDGINDNHYTTYYYSTAGFSNSFNAVRSGRIRFKINIDFINSYLYGRGSSDFRGDDDWGWAGAYFTIIINRYRDGINETIYNTWNNKQESTYYQTNREVALEISHNSKINAQGWPGGIDAAWFTPISNIQKIISTSNSGNPINMLPNDIFTVGVYFLFDAQAYGDEKALGGVNIYDAYGSTGYVEIKPLEIFLEECSDKM